MDTINKHAPLEALPNPEKKRKAKPWLTKGIITSTNKKRQLLTKFKTDTK